MVATLASDSLQKLKKSKASQSVPFSLCGPQGQLETACYVGETGISHGVDEKRPPGCKDNLATLEG